MGSESDRFTVNEFGPFPMNRYGALTPSMSEGEKTNLEASLDARYTSCVAQASSTASLGGVPPPNPRATAVGTRAALAGGTLALRTLSGRE
jgi:hypothetical protein